MLIKILRIASDAPSVWNDASHLDGEIYQLDLPSTQEQWQIKLYGDSLLKDVVILMATATG